MRGWVQVLAVVGALGAVGCAGDGFTSIDRVASLNGSEVCVSNSSHSEFVQCANLAAIDHPQDLSAGACVEVEHAGESAAVLRVTRVVDCAAP